MRCRLVEVTSGYEERIMGICLVDQGRSAWYDTSYNKPETPKGIYMKLGPLRT